MSKPHFSFEDFKNSNGLSNKTIIEKTSLNKNTLTKWNKLTSDKDIQQESILKLLRAFPEIDLAKYFPTHAEIIRLSKKSD